MTARTLKLVLLAGLVLALAAGLGVGLASRGSGRNTASSNAIATPSGGRFQNANPQALATFRDCMVKHGATPPSGGGRPTLDATTQAALQACRQYLPGRPGGGAPPGLGA